MLVYLFNNRLKVPFFSVIWFKLWLKRLYHGPTILVHMVKRLVLKLYGAEIGDLSFVACRLSYTTLGKFKVGSHTFIARDVHIALHDFVTVGSCVVINSGVRIFSGSHDINNPMWPVVSKPIIIGDYCWIASGAFILPGVSIGKGAVVGAGAVVSKDVSDYEVVIGNPAQHLKYRHGPFRYSPTAFSSPVEAWLGSGHINLKA